MTRIHSYRTTSRQTGFTLVEVLVATAIGLIGLAVAGSFQSFQLDTLRDQATQLSVQSSARSFVDLFARELRRACNVSEATPNRIFFQADLNGDSVISGVDEHVGYIYNANSNTLSRVTRAGTEVLVSGVDLTGSGLTYFSGDGTRLSGNPALSKPQRDVLRRVHIDAVLASQSINPRNGSALHGDISTDIELRSRFFINGMNNPNCVPPA